MDQAKDGAEACAFIAAQPRYDLVLSDIKMPHKNGYEIFAVSQKIGHKPPAKVSKGNADLKPKLPLLGQG